MLRCGHPSCSRFQSIYIHCPCDDSYSGHAIENHVTAEGKLNDVADVAVLGCEIGWSSGGNNDFGIWKNVRVSYSFVVLPYFVGRIPCRLNQCPHRVFQRTASTYSIPRPFACEGPGERRKTQMDPYSMLPDVASPIALSLRGLQSLRGLIPPRPPIWIDHHARSQHSEDRSRTRTALQHSSVAVDTLSPLPVVLGDACRA